MRYKVGDVVTVNERFLDDKLNRTESNLVNKKATILEVRDETPNDMHYVVEFKGGHIWFLFDHEVDPIEHEPAKSLRFNEGKPEFSHLSPQFILKMSELMTKSAEKYSRQNWIMRQDLRTAADSMFRHYIAFMSGQDNDEGGSEMSHLLHIAVNAMIMWENYEQYREEVDTRFYKTLKNKLEKGV